MRQVCVPEWRQLARRKRVQQSDCETGEEDRSIGVEVKMFSLE